MKSMRYAYVGRKLKKRDFRKLWITRINAEARINGISYSRLINGLKMAGVQVNRKILADMAVNDKTAFAGMVNVAKKKAECLIIDRNDKGFRQRRLFFIAF